MSETATARFAALGFNLHLAEDEDGVWTASARRADTGEPFGPPVPADRAEEAANLLAAWLEWQRAHTEALAALQTAESAYHRLVAEQAFHAIIDDAGRDRVRAALEEMDERRRHLDMVREQKPWPH